MKELKLRKESLLVRNEVIKVLKDVFNIDFYVEYNDLYWRVNNLEVRRLKGGFRNRIDELIWSEWSKFINEYNFGEDFKVEFDCLRCYEDRREFDYIGDYNFIIRIIYKDEREK